MDVQGLRATVMGLGRHGGGVAAARFLAHRGAQVTVTDLADHALLGQSLQQLADVPIAAIKLGGHDLEDFRHADLVVVNPAVRPDDRFVATARQCGARITSEIEMFLQHCPAQVIGVTGSNGKSTTAAMIAAITTAAGRKTWLGGNIEKSLLPHLNEIRRNDLVVLELSSFQLYWLSSQSRLPDVAVITGCAPNHLDWHGDYAGYAAAKQRLLRRDGGQTVVLDPADERLRSWLPLVAPSSELHPPRPLASLPTLQVPGEHNRRNAALAATAAVAAGAGEHDIHTGLRNFQGLPHRLEHVGEFAGRTIINDSQATTPESTTAALATLSGCRCWLLVGGADKGAQLTGLAAAIQDVAAGAGFFGTTGPQLFAAVQKARPDFNGHLTRTLSNAVEWCWSQSSPGDVVLLSPGCSSRDQYQDYACRAEDFLKCVERCARETHHPARAGELI